MIFSCMLIKGDTNGKMVHKRESNLVWYASVLFSYLPARYLFLLIAVSYYDLLRIIGVSSVYHRCSIGVQEHGWYTFQ